MLLAALNIQHANLSLTAAFCRKEPELLGPRWFSHSSAKAQLRFSYPAPAPGAKHHSLLHDAGLNLNFLPAGTAILGHKAGSQHLTPSFQLVQARPISSQSTENIQEAVTAVNLPLERDPHPGIQRDVSSNLLSPLPRHPYLAECDSLPEKNQGRLLASSARAEKTHQATKMEQSLQK